MPPRDPFQPPPRRLAGNAETDTRPSVEPPTSGEETERQPIRHGNASVPRVAVVTDTTAYLPSGLVEEAGIELVSLYVNWVDGSERESEMANFDAFYERLRSS